MSQRRDNHRYDLSSLSIDEPRRPVNWRWLRAVRFADRNAAPVELGRFSDATVKVAFQYLQARKNAGNDFETLSVEHPRLHRLHRTYNPDGDESGAMHRWMLEAMIMSGQNHKDIATYFRMTNEDVLLYESLFFDVRDRLDSPGFIMAEVLDVVIRGAFDELESDKWWKALGYFGGRAGMGSDLITHYWSFNRLPDGVREWLDDALVSALRKRSLKALNARHTHGETTERLLAALIANRKVENEEKRALAPVDGSTGVRELLEAVTMTVAHVTRTPIAADEERVPALIVRELTNAGVFKQLPPPKELKDDA